MNDGLVPKDDDLRQPQNGWLDPIGRSLRSTFDAPEDEELQPRITSLMIELSHQDFEREVPRHAEAPKAEARPSALVRWLPGFLRRR